MMQRILTFIVWVASCAEIFGATGDILSVEVKPDGWYADITIEGLSTGGTYDLGWDADNTNPESAKIAFTVVSKSVDDAGNATTLNRTIYGGHPVRKPYPNEAQKEESISGSDVIVRVSLSDYIYAKDKSGAGNSGTNVICNILSGFYTQAATPNNAASSFAVTNSSTAAYQPPVANWSWPGYERVTGAFTVRATAFHRDAQQGRPVRAVKFSVTDGTTTVEVIKAAPEIDGTMTDATVLQEYVADFNASSFADDTVLTANIVAWGWIGDSSSWLDSSAGAAAPSPLIGPMKLYCDNDNDAGVYAKVDPTSPSGSPVTYTVGTYNFATAEAYATINAAAAAGANIIELVEDNYAWTGASAGLGSTPSFWNIVRAGPSQARASVVINSASGSSDLEDRVKIEGVTLTAAANNTFSGIDAIWFHNVACNTSGTGILIGGTAVWVTHCDITDMQLAPFSGSHNTNFALVRGCEFLSPFSRSVRSHTMLGNLRNYVGTGNEMFEGDRVTGSTNVIPVPILASNRFFGFVVGAGSLFEMLVTSSQTAGGVMVCNLFEVVDDGPGAISNFNASESVTTNTPIDNVMVWHNTFVGARSGFGYNSSGSTLKHRRYWSVKNNYFESSACKSDLFPTADGARVGNWPILWGVGHSGNVHGGNADVGPVDFDLEWGGINTEDSGTQTSSYAQFVNRLAWDGSAPDGAGMGDYNVQVTSPLKNRIADVVVPYDIDGDPFILDGATGAYADYISTKRPRTPGKARGNVLLR